MSQHDTHCRLLLKLTELKTKNLLKKVLRHLLRVHAKPCKKSLVLAKSVAKKLLLLKKQWKLRSNPDFRPIKKPSFCELGFFICNPYINNYFKL